MKKLLILLNILVLFYSCSSEEGIVPLQNTNTENKYANSAKKTT